MLSNSDWACLQIDLVASLNGKLHEHSIVCNGSVYRGCVFVGRLCLTQATIPDIILVTSSK